MPVRDPTKIILELAESRGHAKSFCPSEAARRINPDSWRAYLSEVKNAASKLTAKGILVCTQRGRKVDPLEAEGPVRYALAED